MSLTDHHVHFVLQDSEMVIKAFKEHERRNGVTEGFAYTPADALAFKYYRDVGFRCVCNITWHG